MQRVRYKLSRAFNLHFPTPILTRLTDRERERFHIRSWWLSGLKSNSHNESWGVSLLQLFVKCVSSCGLDWRVLFWLPYTLSSLLLAAFLSEWERETCRDTQGLLSLFCKSSICYHIYYELRKQVNSFICLWHLACAHVVFLPVGKCFSQRQTNTMSSTFPTYLNPENTINTQ